MLQLVAFCTLLVLASPSPHHPAFTRHLSTLRDSDEYLDIRLPTGVTPLAYNLSLVPFIVEGNFTFDGEVTIRLRADDAVDNITLHVNRLEVDGDGVVVRDLQFGGEVAVVGTLEDVDRQFYTVFLGTPLRPGTEYELVFPKFTGVLDDDNAGFYRSSYVENGERRWLAATQFESTEARRVFPCFDEPALKALFTLSVSRTEGLRTIANMPQDGAPVLDTVHTEELRYWDRFEESPLMPTYLIAFIVSDFVYLENAAERLRIFAQAPLVSRARYSLAVSPPLLNWLADFTGLPFQLPKMDEAAIPDFGGGAMENWGLVTYREDLLLFEEGTSSTANQQNVATVIAHEYAHQWFGDLVSPLWWRYTWLSEGFATYFEYFATANVETSWRLDEQYVVDFVHEALGADSVQTSHPMTVDVYSPEAIEDNFDVIAYSKAGAVIRMMEFILSPAIFRRGLQRYLLSRSYSSATADDLFASLDAQLHEDDVNADDVDVKRVMDTWTLQMGYPLITVNRDYVASTVLVSQERFLTNVIPDFPDDHEYRWHVPLTYTTRTEADFESTATRVWLGAEEGNKTLVDLADADQWVLFNVKEIGYYRVNYDPTNWQLLTDHLTSPDFTDIHVLNRAQLLDDAFALSRAGVNPYSTALTLARYLAAETDYIAWNAGLDAISFLDARLAGTADYDAFQDFVLALLDAVYADVGFVAGPNDGHVLRMNRAAVLRWACRLGSVDCLDQSAGSLELWITGPSVNPIPVDLRATVYCSAVRADDPGAWQFLRLRYEDDNESAENSRIVAALGCSTDRLVLEQYLDAATQSGSFVRRADARAAFTSVYSQVAGVDVALDYVLSNFQRVADYFGSTQAAASIIYGIATNCNRQDQADTLTAFLAVNSEMLGNSASTVFSAISVVEDNVAWRLSKGQEIIDWILTESALAA